jgi:uncharacterized alkaline shock family protein YloU
MSRRAKTIWNYRAGSSEILKGIKVKEPETSKVKEYVEDVNILYKEKIPDIPYFFGLYLRALNKSLERMVIGGITKISDTSNSALKMIFFKLFDYFTKKERETNPDKKMDKNTKPLCASVMMRLYSLFRVAELSKGKVKNDTQTVWIKTASLVKGLAYGSPLDMPYCSNSGLLISDSSVYSYDMDILWRTMMILISEYNTLYFHNHLVLLVDYLMIRAGEFCWVVSDNDDMHNHIIFSYEFVDQTKKTYYKIKDRFFSDCYRTFFPMLAKILNHVQLSKVDANSTEEKFKVSKHIAENVVSWVEIWGIGPFSERIEENFKEMFYENRLYVGERSRYMDEENTQADLAFNVIAKYRPNEIKSYAENLKTPIKYFIERFKANFADYEDSKKNKSVDESILSNKRSGKKESTKPFEVVDEEFLSKRAKKKQKKKKRDPRDDFDVEKLVLEGIYRDKELRQTKSIEMHQLKGTEEISDEEIDDYEPGLDYDKMTIDSDTIRPVKSSSSNSSISSSSIGEKSSRKKILSEVHVYDRYEEIEENDENPLEDLMGDDFIMNRRYDIDIVAMCMCIFEFICRKLLETMTFNEWIIHYPEGTKKNRYNEIKQTDRKMPLMVQTFNEYNLLKRNGEWILCDDFISCFVRWLQEIIEDPELNGKIQGQFDITKLYEMLTSSKKISIQYEEYIPEEKREVTEKIHDEFLTGEAESVVFKRSDGEKYEETKDLKVFCF